MKMYWIWDETFEKLVDALTEWLANTKNVTKISDVQYINADGGWYCILFYQ